MPAVPAFGVQKQTDARILARPERIILDEMTSVLKYHYTECGLPDVWIEGLQAQDDAGEKTVTIPNVRSLHKLISRGIVTSKGSLTGSELRYLRTEMGMTQTQLGKLVHRKRGTILRWERGESTLDGNADAYIRLLAAVKLRLGEIDPEEVSGRCQPTTERKPPIRIEKPPIKIDASDPENYRCAA